jgi:hypothetical protein
MLLTAGVWPVGGARRSTSERNQDAIRLLRALGRCLIAPTRVDDKSRDPSIAGQAGLDESDAAHRYARKQRLAH